MRARVAAGVCLALSLLLGGCWSSLGGIVGPEPEAPAPDGVPARFSGPAPDFAADGGAADGAATRWWTRFGDATLDRLVDRGLGANPDILSAEARVREARAVVRGARAGLRPTLDAAGEAGIEGERTYTDPEADESRSLGGTIGATLGFDWALDLFGGRKRAVQAAEASERLREAERRDAALSVVAEIARTYVRLRGAQMRLTLAEEALELQRRTLEIVRGRVDSGLASELDLSRAQAEMAALEADRAPIRTEIRRAALALAVLVGEAPGTLPAAVTDDGPLPRLDGGPGIGVPTDLLRNRPDLAAAEADLVRATAEIGVAEAALYPNFSLPGRIGFNVTDIATGEVATAVVGSLFLAIDAPLLDGGRREADLDAAYARAEQALLAYHQTLLEALQSVESALEGHDGARRRADALRDAVASAEDAFEQARDLYRQGLANFIEVLDAQRDLTDLRRDLAAATTDQALEAIALYQAVGGTPTLDAVAPVDRERWTRERRGNWAVDS